MNDDRNVDPNKAVDYMLAKAPEYAKARAERIYLEEFRKTKKAILFREAPEKTIAEREHWAYAHPEYQDLLKGIREAVQVEEELRWKLIAAQTRVDVWKATEYGQRQIDKMLK